MESKGRKVTLKTKDMQSFEVDEPVAMQSRTLKGMIEDGCAADAIPLPNVTGTTLRRILDYCEKHAAAAAPKVDGDRIGGDGNVAEDGLKSWDAEYINVDENTLYHLLMAANYMDVSGLLGLCCEAVTNMIKGKTVEEIRTMLNIKCDFTPKEEAEIRAEHEWAFDSK